MGRHPPERTVVARPSEAVDLGGEGLGEQEGDAEAEPGHAVTLVAQADRTPARSSSWSSTPVSGTGGR